MTQPIIPRGDLPRICEGILGTHHYHLTTVDFGTESLCGQWTMQTSIPISAWGFVGDLNERYCAECERIWNEGAKP